MAGPCWDQSKDKCGVGERGHSLKNSWKARSFRLHNSSHVLNKFRHSYVFLSTFINPTGSNPVSMTSRLQHTIPSNQAPSCRVAAVNHQWIPTQLLLCIKRNSSPCSRRCTEMGEKRWTVVGWAVGFAISVLHGRSTSPYFTEDIVGPLQEFLKCSKCPVPDDCFFVDASHILT